MRNGGDRQEGGVRTDRMTGMGPGRRVGSDTLVCVQFPCSEPCSLSHTEKE